MQIEYSVANQSNLEYTKINKNKYINTNHTHSFRSLIYPCLIERQLAVIAISCKAINLFIILNSIR